MSATLLALVVRADDTATLDRYTMDEIRAEIAGWLEGIGPNVLGAPAWFGYCDEEGIPKGKPWNLAATRLARTAGWRTGEALCGTVVFLGPPNEAGEDTDITDEFLAATKYLLAGDESL